MEAILWQNSLKIIHQERDSNMDTFPLPPISIGHKYRLLYFCLWTLSQKPFTHYIYMCDKNYFRPWIADALSVVNTYLSSVLPHVRQWSHFRGCDVSEEFFFFFFLVSAYSCLWWFIISSIFTEHLFCKRHRVNQVSLVSLLIKWRGCLDELKCSSGTENLGL